MLNVVLVWMLMTISAKGSVNYSLATDLESCNRMQQAVIAAANEGYYAYAKCIQIRVDPRALKQ